MSGIDGSCAGALPAEEGSAHKRARVHGDADAGCTPAALRKLLTEQQLRRCEELGVSQAQLERATAAFQLESLDPLKACVQQVVAMHSGLWAGSDKGGGGGGGKSSKSGGSSPSITLWLYLETLPPDAPPDQLPFCGLAVDEMDASRAAMSCLHCTLTVSGMLVMGVGGEASGGGSRSFINGRACRQVGIMVSATALSQALNKVSACSVPLFLAQGTELRVMSVVPGSSQVTIDSIRQLELGGTAAADFRSEGLEYEKKFHAVPQSLVFDHVITMPFDALSRFVKDAVASKADKLTLRACKVNDSTQLLILRCEYDGGSAEKRCPMLVATPQAPSVTAAFGRLQSEKSSLEATVPGSPARAQSLAKLQSLNAEVIAAINGVRAARGLPGDPIPSDADAAKCYSDLCRSMGAPGSVQELSVKEVSGAGDLDKAPSEADVAAMEVTVNVCLSVVGLSRLLKCITCPVVSLRTSQSPTTPAELTYVADGKTLFFNIVSQMTEEA